MIPTGKVQLQLSVFHNNEIEVHIGDSVFLGHTTAEYDRDVMFF